MSVDELERAAREAFEAGYSQGVEATEDRNRGPSLHPWRPLELMDATDRAATEYAIAFRAKLGG